MSYMQDHKIDVDQNYLLDSDYSSESDYQERFLDVDPAELENLDLSQLSDDSCSEAGSEASPKAEAAYRKPSEQQERQASDDGIERLLGASSSEDRDSISLDDLA